jgi:hypothetical protein
MIYFNTLTPSEIAKRDEAVKEVNAGRELLCKAVQKRYAEAKIKKDNQFIKPKK